MSVFKDPQEPCVRTSIVTSNVATVINGRAKYGSATVRSVNQNNPPDFILTTGSSAISLMPLYTEMNIGSWNKQYVQHISQLLAYSRIWDVSTSNICPLQFRSHLIAVIHLKKKSQRVVVLCSRNVDTMRFQLQSTMTCYNFFIRGISTITVWYNDNLDIYLTKKL